MDTSQKHAGMTFFAKARPIRVRALLRKPLKSPQMRAF
jgi:hypothetical protein